MTNKLKPLFLSHSGKFGLWLDSDLNKGRSDECGTYGNPPLVSPPDFTIKTLECWGFLETTSPITNTTIASTSQYKSEDVAGDNDMESGQVTSSGFVVEET